MSCKRIIRAAHNSENPYFMMLRATAQDRNLSWEARGLLCYLLSKPDDWELQISDLQQMCNHGRVYRILKELQNAHYISRSVERVNGKIVRFVYEVYETPFADFVQEEKPQVENRTLHNTDNTERDSVDAKAPQVDTAPKQEKPKRNRKWNDVWYDTVLNVFNLHEGRNVNMQKMLRGEAKDKQHKPYNLSSPLVEPAQIEEWKCWYKAKESKRWNKPVEKIIIPTSPQVVQSSVAEWQIHKATRQNLKLVPSQYTSPLDGLEIA